MAKGKVLKEETGSLFKIGDADFMAIDAISGQSLLDIRLVREKYVNFVGKKIQIIGVAVKTRTDSGELVETNRKTLCKETSLAFHIEGEANTGKSWAIMAKFVDDVYELMNEIEKRLPRLPKSNRTTKKAASA
jgi:hypothetical protein